MSEQEIETDDGETLLETVPLSPKELAFCEAFGNPESESFGNARKSAEAAGYSEPHNAGWKLRRRGRIVTKLKEYHRAVTVAVGRVLADLENERRLAVEKGDIASAIRATELMGKHLGMFLERNIFTVDGPETARYDARVAEQTAAITQILVLRGATVHPPALSEAPPEAEQEQEPQAPQTRQESE